MSVAEGQIHNIQRGNNTTTRGTHSAASIRPSNLRYGIQLALRHPACVLPPNLRDTPPTSTYRLPTLAAPFAAIAWPTGRAPWPTPLGTQRTKMMLHGDQHDMRIFQAKMPLALGGVQRALAFGIRIQRVIAIRMLIIGNRPLIPTTAHRQRVDDRNIAGTIAFRISGDVQHEKAVLEPGVVRNVRLLFKPLQQSDLRFGPFVKQAKVSAGAIAHINTSKVEDQRIAEQRVLCRHSEGKTRLTVRVAGLVIALFVAVARRLTGRTRRDHVHEFEPGVDDIHAGWIRACGFNINARAYGFDLSANFNFSIGNDVYNANAIEWTTTSRYSYRNLLSDMAYGNRWSFIDANGNFLDWNNVEELAALNANTTMWSPYTERYALTDYYVEDASFLRLNTLTLGYTLPQTLTRKIGISNLRFYVTGYNLFCITNYSGFDPEVSTMRRTNLTPGVDYSAYPKSRQFVVGVNLNF